MKTTQKFWNITTGADDSPANLLLYGELANESWYGDEVTPKAFADDLAALGGRDLEVHINSPGGDVFAGQAIYTQLKNYAGNVEIVIDGMCASSATIIAMAGKRVCMPSNAMFMIHNPSVGVMAYLDEPAVDKLKCSLKAVKQTIVNVYRSKVKSLSEQQIKNMMDKESWMTADVAMEYGFVDEIIDPVDASNEVFVNCVDFAKEKYANYGKETDGMNIEEKKSFFDELKKIFGNKQQDAEAISKAVMAERKRVVDLMQLNDGSEAVSKMVDIAIEEGKQAQDIKVFVDAIMAAKPEEAQELPDNTKTQAVNVMQQVIKDQITSGAQDIVPAPADTTPQKQSEQNKLDNFNDVVKAMMALQK